MRCLFSILQSILENLFRIMAQLFRGCMKFSQNISCMDKIPRLLFQENPGAVVDCILLLFPPGP